VSIWAGFDEKLHTLSRPLDFSWYYYLDMAESYPLLPRGTENQCDDEADCTGFMKNNDSSRCFS
jgi:hypothetical protein